MLELIAGVIVAFAALALVLEPLFSSKIASAPMPSADDSELSDIEESESPKIRALLALKEIEFDRATGKLSEEDYAQLKARYSAEAVEAMKQEEAEGAGGAAEAAVPAELIERRAEQGVDPVEAVVQAVKRDRAMVCPACGPRPERAAVYCSSCGRSLVAAGSAPRCWRCGAELPSGARYCARCGNAVAA